MIMNPTPQQIDEQVKLERDAINQGLKRLYDQTIKLENQNYGSATIYGVSSIHTLLPKLISRIIDTNSRIHARKNGVAFKEIHTYLRDMEAATAAANACKITFDKVLGYKDGCKLATNVCESIGHAIEDECQMTHYETHAPALLNVLKKNYWHRSIGTQQKLVVIRTLMNRYKIKQWTTWTRNIRINIGAWLLD